jgi:general secretion pathway protein D
MLVAAAPASAQVSTSGSDSVEVRFIDADLRAVVQGLARYLPKPLVATGLPAVRVSIESPGPVPRQAVGSLIEGLLSSQHLKLQEEPDYFTIVAVAPPAAAATAVDATAARGAVTLHVIRLRHARAADVAATVNLLFGGSGEFSGKTGLTGSMLSEQLKQDLVPNDRASVPVAPPSGPAASLAGPTVIVPDELTNSLLVRASDADFETLKNAIDQLDIRPLQVLIEVLIVEARKDRSLSIGADIRLPPTPLDGGTVSGTTSGGGIGDLILRFMSMGKADVDVVIRAAAARGDARIISRPVLLASNNQEARFLVGSQRPFVQVSRVQPTDNASRDQVVQYKDVGTKLTVKPTINQDRYVSLIIQQEINQATAETQFDAPVISTREARTQVLVRDGQTIVIGGLRDQVREQSRSGVPVLSAIPLLGALFGGQSKRQTETELYLFLTPRIISTDAEADSLTAKRLPPDVQQ